MNGRHTARLKELEKRKKRTLKSKYKIRKLRKLPFAVDDVEENSVIDAVKTIMRWSSRITKAHIKNRGGRAWTIHEQLLHTNSEVAEVYEAIRKSTCVMEITEEMVDIVFSATTDFNIFRFNKLGTMNEDEYYDFISGAVRNVYRRVSARVDSPTYNVERRIDISPRRKKSK